MNNGIREINGVGHGRIPVIAKCVDYIIDLGPEGGEGGGKIIAEGTPAEVAKVKKSYTGKYLKEI